MILLFLGSWRSTLIIAVSIPLSILTSHQHPVGARRDHQHHDARRAGAGGGHPGRRRHRGDREHQPAPGAGQGLHEQAILDGAQQIAVPTFVSTLCICIVFVPMFLLTGVARYLFVPMAEAVVFAMLASYFFSRTLVPTLAKYLLRGSRARARTAPAAVRIGAHARGVRGAASRACARLSRPAGGLPECAKCCFVGAVFCLAASSRRLLLPLLGRDFFPAVDAGQFKLHLRAKTGTRIEETARFCDLVEAKIRRVIPAERTGARSSTTSACPRAAPTCPTTTPARVGPADADIIVVAARRHRPDASEYIRAAARAAAGRNFPASLFYFLPADIVSQILNFGLPAPIDIQMIGRKSRRTARSRSGCWNNCSGVPGIAGPAHQQQTVRPAQARCHGRPHQGAAGRLLAAATSPATCSSRCRGSFQTSPTFLARTRRTRVNYAVITQTPQYGWIRCRRWPISRFRGQACDQTRNPRQSSPALAAAVERAVVSALERAAGHRSVRRGAGPRSGRRGRRSHADRRSEPQRSAEGLATHHSRSDGDDASPRSTACCSAWSSPSCWSIC